jgi:hypothetical protein
LPILTSHTPHCNAPIESLESFAGPPGSEARFTPILRPQDEGGAPRSCALSAGWTDHRTLMRDDRWQDGPRHHVGKTAHARSTSEIAPLETSR